MAEQSMLTSALDMGALLEFSRILNECDDPAIIYSNVLFSLMGKLGLGRAAVAIPDAQGVFTVTLAKGGLLGMAGFSFGWDESCRQGLFPPDHIHGDAEREGLVRAGVEQVIPVCSGGITFALLLLGSSMMGRTHESDGMSYALLVGAIAAMALEGCKARGSLSEMNRRLERRVHRLRSLFEAGREFNALLDRDAIIRLLGYTLMGEMAISRFAVALRNRNGYFPVINHRFQQGFSPEVLERVAERGTRVFSLKEERTPEEESLYAGGVRASIPMEVQGVTRGVLLAGERFRNEIDDEDLEYLCSLANLAVGALENARLLEEIIGKERMEEDLRIAAEIQQGLLPRSLPTIHGFDIAAQTIPTHQVGGDCYDTIELGGGRVLISIADVSGKGTPASLLMASVQAAVRALAQLDLPLDDLTARINDVIYQNTAADKFITAFFGVLNSATSTFSYVNAGHNPPLLFTSDGVKSLDCGGVILGIMPSILPYDVGIVQIQPEDLLILYTDGVSEAMNGQAQEYGEVRLRALFKDCHARSAADALERLRGDVLDFTRGADQSDDITILALRRNSH